MLETVTILRPFPAGTDPGRSDLSYLPFGPATVLEECRQEYAHYAGQKRNPLLTGIRREALEDAMCCPEDNLLERLVGHGPRLRLDAVRVEHVAHVALMIRWSSSASVIVPSACSGARR
jgi:hypothetical protein